MKKLPFLNGLSVLLLTTVTTVSTVKSALALDFTFSFTTANGLTSGTITGLLDNTNGQAGTVTVLSSADGDTGVYGFASGNGFSVSGGNIFASTPFPPGTIWIGVGPGPGLHNLQFTVVGINTALASINGVSNTPPPGTFTPIPTSTPTSNIPFNFSTTPGLIALGLISGANYAYKKWKNKKDDDQDKNQDDQK